MEAENRKTRPGDAQSYRLKRSVVLVGLMGSGKSAVGRTLASRLGVPLYDSDAEIERAAQATIGEIFARDGEPFFRDREAEVLARLLAGPPSVVSTGGGAFVAARNRDEIARRGIAVWLDADVRVLWDRVRHKNTRPLLKTDDPLGTLTALYHERRPAYAQAALRVETRAGYSLDDTTDRVIEALLTHPDILEAI